MKGAGNWTGFVFLLWWRRRHLDFWGTEVIQALSRLATRFSMRQGRSNSSHLCATEYMDGLVWPL